MVDFIYRLQYEPIRAIFRSDGAMVMASECHRMIFDKETNGVWYILNPKKEVIPLVISWIFVPLSSLAGIAFKEENHETLDAL
jgi:hypothetical protein